MLLRQAKDYLIFPLDVPSFEQAKPLIEKLSDDIGIFKVGLELFIRSGQKVIRYIHDTGEADIFLDLKLHDIPTTVHRAMQAIADMDIRFTTVHCGESTEMLEAAVVGSGGKVGVLGVTVLTSVGPQHLQAAGFRDDVVADIPTLVLKKATCAQNAGCAGVVCSALEAPMLRHHLGVDFTIVTPGIRPRTDPISPISDDDQQRVMTPYRAIQNGSDYLVVGRPIRDARDPREAARAITEEIAAALGTHRPPSPSNTNRF